MDRNWRQGAWNWPPTGCQIAYSLEHAKISTVTAAGQNEPIQAFNGPLRQRHITDILNSVENHVITKVSTMVRDRDRISQEDPWEYGDQYGYNSGIFLTQKMGYPSTPWTADSVDNELAPLKV